MGIFSTINTGKQSLLAHQRALQVTSRNIANVNTPGYSRQRPLFKPEPTIPVADGFNGGGGVRVQQVQRIVDERIEAQIQLTHQDLGFSLGMEAGLRRAASALDELSAQRLTEPMQAFFSALGDLSNDPENPAIREQVVRSLDSFLSALRATDLELGEVQSDANRQIEAEIAEVNEIAQNIAQLNGEIVRREFGSGDGFSELRDERTVLLQELSDRIDYTSFERSDGSLAVFVGGGLTLVDGNSYSTLEARTTQPTPLADPTYFNIYHVAQGSVSGPITDRVSGGSIGASIALRDTTIPFYRDQLDSFAATFADSVNTVHLAGRGLDDASARNLIVDLTQAGANPPGATLAAVPGAANRLAVNPDILANVRHLAAGQPAAGAAQPGDNTGALALAALRESAVTFFATGDPIAGPATGPTQTLGGFFSNLTGVLGADLRSTTRAAEQVQLVLDELDDRRGQISGVSLDEEAANLVRFQRGYEASARVISVADSLLETLLSI